MRKYPTAANGSIRLVREDYPLKRIKYSDDSNIEVFNIPKGTWLLVDIFSLQNCSKRFLTHRPFCFVTSLQALQMWSCIITSVNFIILGVNKDANLQHEQ